MDGHYVRFEENNSKQMETLKDFQDSFEENLEGGHKLNTEALNQVPLGNQFLRRIVEHLAFRLAALLLIVTDIVLLAISFWMDGDERAEHPTIFNKLAIAFSIVFVFEIMLRLYVKGEEFFQKWYNTLDFIVVFLTFVVTVVGFLLESVPKYSRAIVVVRLVRIVGFVRFFRFYTEKKNLTKGVRHIISENKRRYRKDGFDLDLVYVTSRIIAMSYPSSGKMSWYRNPIQDVERFFRVKHPDKYLVCNMCSERTYDDSRFKGRILRLNIDDHNVPILSEAIEFIQKAQEFLDADPKNTIAIHCKGGKGRTGTLVCMLLVNNNVFESAKESLQYFGEIRTDLTVGTKFQGVETPSQNRYVEYFEKIRNDLGMVVPEGLPVKVAHIRIKGINTVGNGNATDFRCDIFQGRDKVFDMNFGKYRNCRVVHDELANCVTISPLNFPVIRGDVKFSFFSSNSSVPKGYENCAFFFWFHTAFTHNDTLKLHRNVLDNPHKKKTWTVFGDDFVVELDFLRV